MKIGLQATMTVSIKISRQLITSLPPKFLITLTIVSIACLLNAGCRIPNGFPMFNSNGAAFSSSSTANEIAEPIKDEIKLVEFQQITNETDSVEPEQTAENPESESDDSLASLIDEVEGEIDGISKVDPERPSLESDKLTLDAVLQSVFDCYPEIDVAVGEIESAHGKILSAWGGFDDIFSAHSISQPLGFYQTFRNGAGVTRPLYGGGEVYGTYRIGDGNFEPWFGERETNEGGEFKAGFSLPLVKDRNIDFRRAQLWTAGAQRDQVERNVESRLLMFERLASQAYWDWVASGQAVDVQEQLLRLALQRVKQIDERVKAGDLAEIARIDNDRFIAKRRNSLIKAERALEKAAIKLSLFWRNAQCCPTIADNTILPDEFPIAAEIANSRLQADIATGLSARPELMELRAMREEACIALRYAQNLTLPKFDIKGFAGQDVGGETSPTGDKTPFELNMGAFVEVPIQRREGTGKIRAAEGKLASIDAKFQFQSDKIRVEIQDAASALNAAFRQIEQSAENLKLTKRSLEIGRLLFESGDIDLIQLNIYETAVADAELLLLDARFKYFFYLSIYQTAIGQSRLGEN